MAAVRPPDTARIEIAPIDYWGIGSIAAPPTLSGALHLTTLQFGFLGRLVPFLGFGHFIMHHEVARFIHHVNHAGADNRLVAGGLLFRFAALQVEQDTI